MRVRLPINSHRHSELTCLGEGGTFAIYSLLSRFSNIAKRDPRASTSLRLQRYASQDLQPVSRGVRTFFEDSWLANALLKALAVFGVSLIMADGILTPAQSVLGAVQGIYRIMYA